jgi:glyoxylase-like metal-dependent hydrolase (beta-lactamase superfamily II)
MLMPAEPISPHVYSLYVKLDWFPQPYPPNVFLIADGTEGALIDAGFSDDESISKRLAMLREFPDLNVRYIVITHHHFDHSSGAPKLRDATAAKIVLHRDEAPLLARAAKERIPSDVEVLPERKEYAGRVQDWLEEAAKANADLLVDDGDKLSIGSLTLRMVHSPGHTAGHLSPFLEEDSVIFAGDNVLGVGTTAIPPPPHGDMGQYVASLRKMQSVNAGLMCCGHGPPVKEPNRKLQELIDHRQQREDQILSLVHEGRDTIKGIVKSVYPELDKRLLGMATGQIRSHVAKLESEGKLRVSGEGEDASVSLV